MKPGHVVEFVTGEERRLGAVLDVVGKVKLLVLTSDGSEQRPTRDDITFTLAGNFERGDRDGARRALDAVEQRVDGIAASLDLEVLWNAADPSATYEIAELARLSGQGGGMVNIALGRLLRENSAYFRQRKGRFSRRTEEQVQDNFEAQRQQAEKVGQRARFVAAVAALFQRPRAERAAAYRALVAEPGLSEWRELLEGFAADETGYPRREDAERLIDELAAAADLRLNARANPRGFELMLELGLWHEHEITALHRFGVVEQHSPEALDAADEAVARGFDRDGRTDFTSWWTATIDAASSRDLDDALSIRPTLEGGWEVAVHIADPDAYAPIGSLLDQQAARRGATIYLPDRTVDMFPSVLSHGAMSLVQGAQRPAVTTHVVFDSDLDIESVAFTPSIVEVNRRLSYAEVDAMLESASNDHTTSVVRDLAYIADELHARRLARGARAVELPETVAHVDLETTPTTIAIERQDPSPARSLVAEFMVLVGELTAKWCVDHDVPLIFRAQQPPHAERGDHQIQRIPEGWAREFAVLMSMQRGALGVTPAAHAALGVDVYAQSTSPIRRYSDLVVQRQLKAALRGAALPYSELDLHKFAHTVEQALHEAHTIQDEATQYWLLEQLHHHEGEVVDAVLVARREDRHAEVILVSSGYRTRAKVRSNAAVGDTIKVRIDRARPRPPVLVLEQVGA